MATFSFPSLNTSFGLSALLAGSGGGGAITRNTVFVKNPTTSNTTPGGNGTYESPYAFLYQAMGDAGLQSNSGDGIVVLPGHFENITSATYLTQNVTTLKTGLTVLCWGNGANTKPTFRFTATAAQAAFSGNDWWWQGGLFRLEGANGITKAINITATDFTFAGTEFEMASGAANKAAIGVEIAGARASFLGCTARGTSDIVTDGFKHVGAVAGFTMVNCDFQFAATAANGCVNFTAALTNGLIKDSSFFNTGAASTAAVNFANVATQGFLVNCNGATQNNGVSSAQNFVFGAAALWRSCQSFGSDEPARNGVLAPVVVAT